MNLIHTDFCPICHQPLTQHADIDERAFECRKHYFVRVSLFDPNKPDYLVVFIPGFELQYTWSPEETYILKTKNLFGGRVGATTESYERIVVCNVKEHFPIDWDNLEQTSQRIKNLMVFS